MPRYFNALNLHAQTLNIDFAAIERRVERWAEIRQEYAAVHQHRLTGREATFMVMDELAMPSINDWLTWTGDEHAPVPGNTRVEVQLRNGSSGEIQAGMVSWQTNDHDGDIAYWRPLDHQWIGNHGVRPCIFDNGIPIDVEYMDGKVAYGLTHLNSPQAKGDNHAMRTATDWERGYDSSHIRRWRVSPPTTNEDRALFWQANPGYPPADHRTLIHAKNNHGVILGPCRVGDVLWGIHDAPNGIAAWQPHVPDTWLDNRGVLPVEPNTPVIIEFRDGEIGRPSAAGVMNWNIEHHSGDIIRWRLNVEAIRAKAADGEQRQTQRQWFPVDHRGCPVPDDTQVAMMRIHDDGSTEEIEGRAGDHNWTHGDGRIAAWRPLSSDDWFRRVASHGAPVSLTQRVHAITANGDYFKDRANLLTWNVDSMIPESMVMWWKPVIDEDPGDKPQSEIVTRQQSLSDWLRTHPHVSVITRNHLLNRLIPDVGTMTRNQATTVLARALATDAGAQRLADALQDAPIEIEERTCEGVSLTAHVKRDPDMDPEAINYGLLRQRFYEVKADLLQNGLW